MLCPYDRAMQYTKDSGFVLAWVLMVICFLMTLGLGLLSVSQWEGVQVTREIRYLKAFNLAEAGIERSILELQADPMWLGGWQDEPLGDGTYAVTTEDLGSGWIRVRSTGSVGDVPKTVTLRVFSDQRAL